MKYKKPIFDFRFNPFTKNHKLWPISVGYSHGLDGKGTHAYFTIHGWQCEWNKGERVYGWTLHLHKVKIFFGPRKKARGIATGVTISEELQGSINKFLDAIMKVK